MKPVVTVEEMRAADAAALRAVEESVLVRRAGAAVARAGVAMLGSAYGRKVVVVAGKGNNGNDGRVAASLLRRRGARVEVVEVAEQRAALPPVDLVIDAAFGTGFRGSYEAPAVAPGSAVLAVDIPSGVDGDTGAAAGRPMVAQRTVTMAAYKAGLLQGAGPLFAGTVEVADIGVPIERAQAALVEDADVDSIVPDRPYATHKWATSVAVVAGSPGMEGAAALSAQGASRGGAGMVRLVVPGTAETSGAGVQWPRECVRVPAAARGWADRVLGELERCRALVIGPGLGRDDRTQDEIRRVLRHAPVPVVADADALVALGSAERARELLIAGRPDRPPVILTPHDGEYRGLAGASPGGDRIGASRRLAQRTGAIVLLKGPVTAVARPVSGGEEPSVLLSATGTSALATAGTGDVLSGLIGAFVARGVEAAAAAALAAHVHGAAAALGHAEGLVAPDLPGLIATWRSRRSLQRRRG